MNILKFLGRGSAFNVKEGNTSAYYFNEKHKHLMLFDCGEDIFNKIVRLLDTIDVNIINICITHTNSDHIGSLSSLIFYLHYKKPNIKYNIITGFLLAEDVRKILTLMGNSEEQLNNIIKIDDYSGKKSKFLRSIRVKHIDDMSCYGYVFGKSYYSGDSNNIPEEILNNIDKFDYIYQDTCLADYEGNVHLSLRKLCELIPTEYRHKVWCMHLDCDELIEKAKEEGFNVVEVEK